MKAPSPAVKPGFVIYLDGLACSDKGERLKVYVQLDRFGPAGPGESVGFPADSSMATPFSHRAAQAWLAEYPRLATRAHIVHPLTGIEVPT